MVNPKRVFQISGIKIGSKMGKLVNGIQELGGTYIGCKGYVEKCTHLIVPWVVYSEKFIAACAAGRWVLTPDYVTDSFKSGSWLAEEPYEVPVFPPGTPAAFYPTRPWREKVKAGGRQDGAFRGWRVVLRIRESSRRDMFYRVLKAGKAIVCTQTPPSHKSITHVFVKPASEIPERHGEPCFPVSHIIHYLFGDDECDESSESLDADEAGENESSDAEEFELESGLRAVMRACTLSKEDRGGDAFEPSDLEESEEHEEDFSKLEEHEENFSKLDEHEEDFSKLEAELLMYALTIEERPTQSDLYHACDMSNLIHTHSSTEPSVHPVVQEARSRGGFNNASLMAEGGLFSVALEDIISFLSPGLLPPTKCMASLLRHALQGEASPVFYRDIQVVLDRLLHYNPPWLSPRRMRKYFTDVLQCPVCERGLWPFLETAISYCLSREDTCHPLPGHVSPALLGFQRYLLQFVVRLFHGEFSAITTASVDPDSGLAVVVSHPSLYGMWTVWERSTVLSVAVKRLCELLICAVVWEQDHPKRDLTQRELVDILLDLLSVLVEFWCQQHVKRNRVLMETSLNDLAELIAVLGQDLSPEVLVDLVHRIPSSTLGLVTADAVFRHLCHRSGFSMGDEPLSVKKMVSSYLPALGMLGGGCSRADSGGSRRSWPGNEPDAHSWTGPGTASGLSSPDDTSPGKENRPEKENLPRGLNRVNRAGETIAHRMCKTNRVERLLQILSLPNTDVNATDHVGWTPLHEACNHGSTACVEALLRHRPPPHLNTQVNGVSPLHDALLNGHMDIARMLLEHAGSDLLQQTTGCGRSPLDLVPTATQREELLRSARLGDLALKEQVSVIRDLPLLEACASLLGNLLVSYLQATGSTELLCDLQPDGPTDAAIVLGHKLAGALAAHPLERVTAAWTDRRALRLAEDMEELVELGRGGYLGHVVPAVAACEGENTRFLMDILEEVKERAAALMVDNNNE